MSLDGLMPMFKDHTPVQFAIRQYCANCVAHRLTKFGWEESINFYEPRLIILLAMMMPSHTRIPMIMEAWGKAMTLDDQNVIDFCELHFQAKLVRT